MCPVTAGSFLLVLVFFFPPLLFAFPPCLSFLLTYTTRLFSLATVTTPLCKMSANFFFFFFLSSYMLFFFSLCLVTAVCAFSFFFFILCCALSVCYVSVVISKSSVFMTRSHVV